MSNIKDWKSFNENLNQLELDNSLPMNTIFKSREEFISFWEEKWSGTEAERFPREFLESFPTQEDYSEFEKEEYDYQDEDEEFEFWAEDEISNISSGFNINIGNGKEDDISEKDWVDFYNTCWTWL